MAYGDDTIHRQFEFARIFNIFHSFILADQTAWFFRHKNNFQKTMGVHWSSCWSVCMQFVFASAHLSTFPSFPNHGIGLNAKYADPKKPTLSLSIYLCTPLNFFCFSKSCHWPESKVLLSLSIFPAFPKYPELWYKCIPQTYSVEFLILAPDPGPLRPLESAK